MWYVPSSVNLGLSLCRAKRPSPPTVTGSFSPETDKDLLKLCPARLGFNVREE